MCENDSGLLMEVKGGSKGVSFTHLQNFCLWVKTKRFFFRH